MTATIVGPGGVVDQGEAGTEAWPVSIDGEINVDVDVSALATQATLASILTALTDGDEAATLAKLEAIRALLALPLALDAATLTALETITVANPTTNPETGLATEATLDDLRDRLPANLDTGSLAVIDQDPGDRSQFESYLPPTSDTYQIRYIGSATQGTANAASTWIVKRLTWERLADGADHITDLQTLVGIWTDRATLGWS